MKKISMNVNVIFLKNLSAKKAKTAIKKGVTEKIPKVFINLKNRAYPVISRKSPLIFSCHL